MAFLGKGGQSNCGNIWSLPKKRQTITICTPKILFTTSLKNDQIWGHFDKFL